MIALCLLVFFSGYTLGYLHNSSLLNFPFNQFNNSQNNTYKKNSSNKVKHEQQMKYVDKYHSMSSNLFAKHENAETSKSTQNFNCDLNAVLENIINSNYAPEVRANAVRALFGQHAFNIVIQALKDKDNVVREAAIKKIIEISEEESSAHIFENYIRPLIYSEIDDDVIGSIIEFYDYHYFSEPQKIIELSETLLERDNLSEDVISRIAKTLSEYDIDLEKIKTLIIQSQSFQQLELNAQVMVRTSLERMVN